MCKAVSHALAVDVPIEAVSDTVTQTERTLRSLGPALVVLDNFEQVIDAAGRTVGQWLDFAPDVRFLVTSRESLRLPGERVHQLAPLPTGGQIEQSDGTGWMGAYCLSLMRIALELAMSDRVYEDIATKFFEHFLYIADAMTTMGAEGDGLWDDEDEFYYDTLRLPDGRSLPLKVHSMVGLIPLFATETIEPEMLAELPGFRSRLGWFLKNRSDLAALISHWELPGVGALRLVALTRGHRMKRLLARALDPAEFLSDYGLRSLSRIHAAAPYTLSVDGVEHAVAYEPAESRTGVFGGNSNWRGPVWFPLNYLLIESLRKFHAYYGDDFKVECPTGSGKLLTLAEIADMLARRLIALFVPGPDGVRPSALRDPAVVQLAVHEIHTPPLVPARLRRPSAELLLPPAERLLRNAELPADLRDRLPGRLLRQGVGDLLFRKTLLLDASLQLGWRPHCPRRIAAGVAQEAAGSESRPSAANGG